MPQACELFVDGPFRWWISGGHAFELHTGDSWRDHGDMDIGICRSDAGAVHTWLTGWQFYVAAAGRLARWHGRPLDAARSENNVWVRESTSSPWRFELTVGSGTEQKWVYRRDPSITRPWHQAVLVSSEGAPYLAPDLQLLFKAKKPRPKDHEDATRVIPTLDTTQQRFLEEHLAAGHPWQAIIRSRL